MIQVRQMFQVKFGKIDQAVELFRRAPAEIGGQGGVAPAHYHLLTDISGPMYTLIFELFYPDTATWERQREESYRMPGYDNWFKEFQLLVEEGSVDYYTVEGELSPWSRPGVVVVRQVYRALKWQIRPAVGLLQRYGALLVDCGVGRNPRILTDRTGPMFQAVIEVETDGLSEWETARRRLFTQAEFQVWFVQLLTCVESGQHELYRVEI